jgi:hypothetical protein
MPPASDRPNGQAGAGSAWSAAEADQPAPPSLQVVDQALGQIATLELELSRIVTQDIGSWRLEELQSRITEVYNRTQDPEVQRSLAHIARRTQEFVDLQRRHQALLASGPAAIPVALPTPSLDPPRAAALAGTAPRDPLASLSEPLTNLGESLRRATSDRLKTATTERPPQSFSGRGWLVPVLTARPDLPRFALTGNQPATLHAAGGGYRGTEPARSYRRSRSPCRRPRRGAEPPAAIATPQRTAGNWRSAPASRC